MKKLNQFIIERLKLSKNDKIQEYNYHPKTKDELKELVNKLIKERGNDADLNDIDTSEITDMSEVFYFSKFNGDISEWDVSNVTNMRAMFMDSQFNGDISQWNVSHVRGMDYMFCQSKFNGDISKWNVSKVKNMECMFYICENFNYDLSHWDVSNVDNMREMFYRSPLEKNPPKWYKEE